MKATPSDKRPTVIVLHGLGQDQSAVEPLRSAIVRAGYPTWSCSYPSRKASIVELADAICLRIEKELAPREPLWAITHSMGGILLRYIAKRFAIARTVMICPPNRGSRVAARLSAFALYRSVFGPAGRELADSSGWPAPPEPFAVIGGDRGLTLGNPTSWVSAALSIFPPNVANDGTVALAEMVHPQMSDFAVVDASHTGILTNAQAHRLVLEYLQYERFLSKAEELAFSPSEGAV